MRKNNVDRKRISLPSFYSRYEIVGLNLDRLLTRFVKKGIALYNVKRIKQNKIRLTIKFSDTEKFFANFNELCYNEKNVRKIRDGGLLAPINFLIKNLGVLFGIIIFFTSAFFFDDFILDLSFSGTGAVYERQLIEVLDEYGAHKYTKFSSLNLRELEDRLVEKTEGVSFVALKKEGKTLSVYSVKSEGQNRVLSGNERRLTSTVTGIIESIKVYRGTPLLSVGDKVCVGDVIVDGFTVRNEVVHEINVIASASILESVSKTYVLEKTGLSDIVVAFLEEELTNKNVVSVSVDESFVDGKYQYVATATTRVVVFVG